MIVVLHLGENKKKERERVQKLTVELAGVTNVIHLAVPAIVFECKLPGRTIDAEISTAV